MAIDKAVEVAREMLAAMIEDFGDPDDYPEDDGPVAAGADSQAFITFKMLRDWRAAITATDKARAVTDEEVTLVIAQTLFDTSMGGTSDPTLTDMLASICQGNARDVMSALHTAGFKVIRG